MKSQTTQRLDDLNGLIDRASGHLQGDLNAEQIELYDLAFSLAEVNAAQSLNRLAETSNDALLAKLADYFAQKGCDIISHHCLNIADDRDIARVNEDDLINMAEQIDQPEADAIFLSCTALPAVAIINRLEDRLGKPVITSNQAMIWMALRLAGCDHQAPQGGKLFTLGLPQ